MISHVQHILTWLAAVARFGRYTTGFPENQVVLFLVRGSRYTCCGREIIGFPQAFYVRPPYRNLGSFLFFRRVYPHPWVTRFFGRYC